MSTRSLPFFWSSTMNFANASLESPTGSKPLETRYGLANSGVFTMAANSALSFLTISAGVPFGANMPNQVSNADRSGDNPDSPNEGTSGMSGLRLSPGTSNPLTSPSL